MKRTAFSPHNDLYIQYLKNTEKHNMPVQYCHDMYEIYLQLGGRRYFFYDHTCYALERGDVAIIKPFDIHYGESRESDYYERYVINFNDEGLRPLLSSEELNMLRERLSPCVIHLTEEQTQEAYRLFRRADEYSARNGFLSKKLLCSAVLQVIMHITDCAGEFTVIKGKSADPQIVSALKYLNTNYKSGITLDDVAAAVNTSKYHLCRRFHDTTGATIFEYLNNLRLAKVHNMLINTDCTIDEIVKETGFSSSVNLTRAFKKLYGIPPTEFRKAYVGRK